jgi:site-specific recombinase XerD
MSVGALEPDQPTELRLNKDLLSAYVSSMHETLRAHTIRNSLHNLTLTFEAMVPGHDFKWIRKHPDYPTTREVLASKKPVRPPNSLALFSRALRDANEVVAEEPTHGAAIKYRNAVMLLLLVAHAIRLKNLAEIRIGEHVLVCPTHVRLVFEESVKNREVIDVVLSGTIERHVRTYIEVYRPLLLHGREDDGALWLTALGRPLRYVSAGHLVMNITAAWGLPTNAHGVRYALATTIMSTDPRRIAVASAALAHRGVSSVNAVYDRSGGDAAQAKWEFLLAKLVRQ